MREIRRHQVEPEVKIVVRGAACLAEVWPVERDVAPVVRPVPALVPAPAPEVTGIDAVVALLASADDTDLAAYQAWHGQVTRLAS